MRTVYAVSVLLFFGCGGALVSPATAQWTPLDPVTNVTKQADGVRASFGSGAVLNLQICSDSIIHVAYSPTGAFPERHDDVVTKTTWPIPPFLRRQGSRGSHFPLQL
jgi:hypothetical protein